MSTLTEQDFHTVSSLRLTAAENAVWGRTTGSLPHEKQFTLKLQVTTVFTPVISHPAPSNQTSYYIRDEPSYTLESNQFVYPWQAILHLLGTSRYIRDEPFCCFDSRQFVYPWRAILRTRVKPLCISVTRHPALSGHTNCISVTSNPTPSGHTRLYIRDKQSYTFGSHAFRLGNKVNGVHSGYLLNV